MNAKQKELIKNLLKNAKAEMKIILKEQGFKKGSEFDTIDVDDMNPNDAFSRGFYRALEGTNRILQEFLDADK